MKDPPSSGYYSTSLSVALFSVLFLVIFNYTLTIMASLYIVSDLGGSPYTTTYTISFFSLGNALGVPLGRALAGHIGAVRLLIWTLLLFAFFSFLSSHATTFAFFLAARFLQGFVSGPFYSLLNRLLGALVPQEKQPQTTSIMLTLFTIGPVIGATWGGWIAYDYHWRLIFYIDIPCILFLAYFIHHRLKNFELLDVRNRFDAVGYFFFFIGLFTLAFVLTTGQELDWFTSKWIIACTSVAIPSLVFFILWSLHHPEPIIDFRLLKNPAATFALINLTILFSIYFGMIILLALWLSLYANYTPIWIGILLGTMAITGIIPSFLTGRFGRLDTRLSLLIAIFLLALSCFHTASFNVDINFGRIAFSRILAGFGLAFFLPPIFRLCFHTIESTMALRSVILFQIVRALASGLGASLYIILWQRRQTFYHARLGSQLTAFSESTRTFLEKAIHDKTISSKQALAALEYYLERQATSLALNDCFYLMGWILVLAAAGVVFASLWGKVNFLPEQLQKDVGRVP